MNKRTIFAASASAIMALALTFAADVAAQPAGFQADPSDGPIVVTSPSPWATLRSDSVVVSVQADPAFLPKGSIDFKAVRRSGARSSTLFTRSVKMDGPSADVFLGRVRDVPLGGSDFLSIEWSVPGSELKGVIEPVGVVPLGGAVSSDGKWVPARPPLAAMKLGEGVSGAAAAEALAGAEGFEVGGMKFAAGWNTAGLFIMFTPADGVTGVEFAFDLKCGKSAFLAWADRFILYDAAGDGVRGVHYGGRSVGKDGIASEEMVWVGRSASLAVEKAEKARVVMVQWPDLGMQPFEERSVGFSVFANGGRLRKHPVSYPASARREVPGTWGEIKLAK